MKAIKSKRHLRLRLADNQSCRGQRFPDGLAANDELLRLIRHGVLAAEHMTVAECSRCGLWHILEQTSDSAIT